MNTLVCIWTQRELAALPHQRAPPAVASRMVLSKTSSSNGLSKKLNRAELAGLISKSRIAVRCDEDDRNPMPVAY